MPKNIDKKKVFVRTERLLELIEKMNLFIGEFARNCKMSPSYFSMHLKNGKEFSPVSRKRIMSQLNKNYQDLKWDDIFYFNEE